MSEGELEEKARIVLKKYSKEASAKELISTAHGILKERAKRKKPIAYIDLANELNAKISGLKMTPRSGRLHAVLTVLSKDSKKEKRGMLSVAVVYKHSPKIPGPGFFKLARELKVPSAPPEGSSRAQNRDFFNKELEKVHRAYTASKKGDKK